MSHFKINIKVFTKALLLLIILATLGIFISVLFALKTIGGLCLLLGLISSSFYLGKNDGKMTNLLFSGLISVIVYFIIAKYSSDAGAEYISMIYSTVVFLIMLISGFVGSLIHLFRKRYEK